MNGDQLAQLVWILAALMLPLSALIARRMEWGKTVQLALIWAAIFIIGLVIVRLIMTAA